MSAMHTLSFAVLLCALATAQEREAPADKPPPPRSLENDPQQQFYLHPARGKPAKTGHGLLVVLPGGDGSADFHGFVKNIAAHAVPADYVVVQLIAPAHKRSAELVWPKRKDDVAEVKLATEDAVSAVIALAGKEHKIDPRRVFVLAWSSGGPPTYALSVDPASPVRGALVAMSVFHKNEVKPIDGAKGRAFYVLHSPQDFIALDHAKTAVKELERGGAKTKLVTYEGGHGWHGDVFGNIAAGVKWLEDNASEGKKPAKGAAKK